MKTNSKVVVVGDDFGPMGDDAVLAGLAQLASGNAGSMHVAHVYDPGEIIDHPEKRVLETEEEMVAEGPAALLARVRYLALLAGLPYDAQQVRTHARLGKPVETLLQMCVDYDADLLIVGTHGRRGVDRWMMGSVAEALVRQARCPVLVARPKNYLDLAKTPLPDPAYAPGTEPKRGPTHDSLGYVGSTTHEGWHPSDNGPTGFRIV
jgi:nucleotide-binding universal stress UspA family protein